MTAPIKNYDITFSQAPWIRDSGVTVFEERPARIEDLCAQNGGTGITKDGVIFNANALGNNQPIWKISNPKFQNVLDKYLIRRGTIRMKLHKECSTSSITEDYLVFLDNFDDISEYYKVSGTVFPIEYSVKDGSEKYLIESFEVEDYHNSKSKVTIRLRFYSNWKLVPVVA